MRYQILGPACVIGRDRSSSINARKIELLLIALLSRANRIVPARQLMQEIWSDVIPQRATAGIYVYISQLRKFLDQLDSSADHIRTQSQGYLLRVGSGELDASLFLQDLDTGRTHARYQRYELASSCFEDALNRWRGPTVWSTDCGPLIQAYATYLTERRLEGIEMLVDARLELGHHRELAGWLYTLTTEYPMREVFYRQLMLALYRSERQADALNVYRCARQALLDELGLEPCRSLRHLHQSILTADDELLNAYASSPVLLK
jgi:SARP family transcriptional regulator, regulator of embCAB operon